MQADLTDSLIGNFLDAFEPPFTGSIPQWLEKNVYIDGKRFNSGLCPWLNDIYSAIQDPNIDVVVIEGAAGTFKTGVLDCLIPWWCINDSGPVLRICHRDEVAKDFTKTRILPMLESCVPIKSLFNGEKIRATNNLITFPHMHVKSSGPSEKIQFGYSTKYLQLDECHNITEPLENFFRRVRKNYGRTQIVISSTPGQQLYRNGELIGDQLALLVNSSRVMRRSWKCPHCHKYQVWRWSAKREGEKDSYSGINWEDVKKDKELDINLTSNTAKLECHFCHGKVDDLPSERIKLEQTAKYELIHDGGNPRMVTFQFPAWVAPHNSFKEACIQYLKAKQLADAHIYDKLKEFMQQVAAEEWTRKSQKIQSRLVYNKFDSNSEVPGEKFRFMGVDLQGDGRRYYMIVAFDAVGNGWLINYGCVHSWLEVEQLAIKYKVQKENGENAYFVGVDVGHDWHEVAKETVRHGIDKEFEENGQRWKERFGWLCLRGDGKDHFQWEDGVKRVISPQGWYDTTDDTPPARYHFWSNRLVKTLVASIRDGHNKLKLNVNTQDENLQRQLYSEYPNEHGIWTEKSKENHLWDCLCECYAMGILAGIPFLGLDSVPTP